MSRAPLGEVSKELGCVLLGCVRVACGADAIGVGGIVLPESQTDVFHDQIIGC